MLSCSACRHNNAAESSLECSSFNLSASFIKVNIRAESCTLWRPLAPSWDPAVRTDWAMAVERSKRDRPVKKPGRRQYWLIFYDPWHEDTKKTTILQSKSPGLWTIVLYSTSK